ncbi:MAG TPA: enoyl-CoA hydratase/isomerase family protein [Pyrinomonadaceae bacterium]|nr:enoyl-CoA hydratase/isomerase family protein [Pyrinomonadaceae bacterium]
MSENVLIETSDGIVIVRFTRPERKNPLSRSVIEHLHALADALAADRSVEKVILTGIGDAFASGANLHEIAALSAEDAPEFAHLGQSLMQKIVELPQIVIAAVNGHCFGGGLDLALACDARIASPNARFAHPGASLGIITGWGGTQRLPRLVGEGNALEMFFSADPISAERAFAIGLVDEISNDLLTSALQCARSV